MRGLKEVPAVVKNRLFPVVRLRPWLTASSFDRAIEVTREAVGDGTFGFDLDDTKFDPNSDRAAVKLFTKLFSPVNGYQEYYEFLVDKPDLVPVFRDLTSDNTQGLSQIYQASLLDRGLFVRVDLSNPGSFLDIARLCVRSEMKNVVFIFDCGWRRDPLPFAAICVGFVKSLLEISDEFEIVITSSSFPADFTDQGNRFSVRISERDFYNLVRSQINIGKIFYGDWGSTRSPRLESQVMRSRPRIDLARHDSWMFWRSDGVENYQMLAKRAVMDHLWQPSPSSWGKYLINCTALGVEPCIRSAVMAAAARINTHLIEQCSIESSIDPDQGDELLGDDF